MPDQQLIPIPYLDDGNITTVGDGRYVLIGKEDRKNDKIASYLRNVKMCGTQTMDKIILKTKVVKTYPGSI